MKALTAARSIAARVGSRLVSSPTTHEPPLVLVFSKNHAIALELFLRSFAQHMSPPAAAHRDVPRKLRRPQAGL
jgi:hypothetical protein